MTGPSRIDDSEIRASLRRLLQLEPPLRRATLRRSAEAIVSEAQQNGVVPFKTGALQASHTVDASNPDRVVIGANIEYAAAVHERHPTKRHWFLDTIISRGPVIFRAALRTAGAGAGGQAR